MFIVRNNKIGDIPFGLGLEERFDILHQAAGQNSRNAFLSLFRAYAENKLGDDPLNLSAIQRQEKLFELRSLNPKVWASLMPHVMECNKHQLPLSDSDRFKWLEDQALNQHNSSAQEVMAGIYAENRLKSTNKMIHLEIPLEERLKQLFFLADDGCKKAQLLLLNAFQDAHYSCSETVVDDQGKHFTSRMEEKELLPHLITWSLQQDTLLGKTLVVKIRDDETLSFLFSVRETMRMVGEK